MMGRLFGVEQAKSRRAAPCSGVQSARGYPLPPSLLGQLTPAPAGYQYVRVANDILMLSIGTQLIVSAIANLSAM